jgi:hypothetical protein
MLLVCVGSCVAVARIKLVKVEFSRVIFKDKKNQVVHMSEKKKCNLANERTIRFFFALTSIEIKVKLLM